MLSLSRKWECVVVVVVVVYFRSAREVLLVRLTLAVSCVYRRDSSSLWS